MRFKLTRTALLTAPAVALALSGPLFADDSKTEAPQRSGAQKQRDVTRAVRAEAPRLNEQTRASRLVGMEVVDRGGQNIGEVEDLVIDMSDDRVRYAVISSGGFLDIGDRHYVYTLDQFSKTPEGDRLTLNADAESIKRAPSFESGGWPAFNDPIWPRASGSDTDLRRVSDLLGMDVKSPSGVQVGDLKDFAIELQSGEARAILEFDPGDYAEERLVAVPPARLGIPRQSNQAVVNMTRSELMNAPRVRSSDFST